MSEAWFLPSADFMIAPDSRLVTTLAMGQQPSYTGDTQPDEDTTASVTDGQGETTAAIIDGTVTEAPPARKGCRSTLLTPAALLLALAGVAFVKRHKE